MRLNWFSVVILVVVMVFIFIAFDFTPRARVVPLVVAIPTFLLTFASLTGEVLSDAVKRKGRNTKQIDGNSGKTDRLKMGQSQEELEAEPAFGRQQRRKLLAAFSPIAMLVLMGLFGLIGGGMIYVAAYYYINGESRFITFVTPLLLGIMMYVLFVHFLRIDLWTGLFF